MPIPPPSSSWENRNKGDKVQVYFELQVSMNGAYDLLLRNLLTSLFYNHLSEKISFTENRFATKFVTMTNPMLLISNGFLLSLPSDQTTFWGLFFNVNFH